MMDTMTDEERLRLAAGMSIVSILSEMSKSQRRLYFAVKAGKQLRLYSHSGHYVLYEDEQEDGDYRKVTRKTVMALYRLGLIRFVTGRHYETAVLDSPTDRLKWLEKHKALLRKRAELKKQKEQRFIRKWAVRVCRTIYLDEATSLLKRFVREINEGKGV